MPRECVCDSARPCSRNPMPATDMTSHNVETLLVMVDKLSQRIIDLTQHVGQLSQHVIDLDTKLEGWRTERIAARTTRIAKKIKVPIKVPEGIPIEVPEGIPMGVHMVSGTNGSKRVRLDGGIDGRTKEGRKLKRDA